MLINACLLYSPTIGKYDEKEDDKMFNDNFKDDVCYAADCTVVVVGVAVAVELLCWWYVFFYSASGVGSFYVQVS